MAKVSIIMPVYNSEEYVELAIQSVLAQTYKDWELIIIDDHSTDKSLDIINRLKTEKFHIIQNSTNIGPALSRNGAIKQATGRYIAFIDSDDIWNVEKLEKQIDFMEENDIAFSFSGYYRIADKTGYITRKVEIPKEISYSKFLKNTIILNSTVVLDSETISKELIQMPDMRRSEDVAMYLKILKTGIVAYGLNEPLIKYRVRKKSLSSNKFKNIRSMWRIYRKNEKLNIWQATKNMLGYIKNGISKRIPLEVIKRIKEIFHLVTVKECFEFLAYPFICLINIFVKKKIVKKKAWLIEENPSEACDNGYIFYKYLRENRKDINTYYVIKKNSKDYKKVESLGETIQHGSLRHWLYYLNADKIIVTQKYANPSTALFYILHKKNRIKAPRIFLQHGVIKDDCPMFYYDRCKFRIFICGAKREYEYIDKSFGYPKGYVAYTGLARFDNLDLEPKAKNNLILVAPTWRNWIKTQKDFNEFINNYYELLKDECLNAYLKDNKIILQFVLHKNMKRYKLDSKLANENIIIKHNYDVDIQDLINKADMLITDYSSIFMDFAYRKRPIIYYQFDKKLFRQRHLPKGYFSYKDDGFGEILEDKNSVINKLKHYVENDFAVEEKYSQRMDDFFERKDKNNCKRILEEIEKIR